MSSRKGPLTPEQQMRRMFPDFLRGMPRTDSGAGDTRRVTRKSRWRDGMASVPWPNPQSVSTHVFATWLSIRNALDPAWDHVSGIDRQQPWWYRCFALWLMKEAVNAHVADCQLCSEQEWDFVTSRIYETPEGADFDPRGGADDPPKK